MSASVGMRLTPRERIAGILFILPATAIIAVFLIWPTINMFWLSLHAGGSGAFVGFANYADVGQDRVFHASLRNTALFAVGVVPIQTALALLFAVWVNGGRPTQRILRLCAFVPTTISLAVLAVVWDLMYKPVTPTRAGLINSLLAGVHQLSEEYAWLGWLGWIEPVAFLQETAWALPALILMSIWQGLGLQMLIFLSGLQQIPGQLYESADIDGASAPRKFISITLPGVAPTAVFVIMITTIFALRLFVQPFLMTGGGPQNATVSVVQYIYEAFSDGYMGIACAAAVIFFAAVLVVTLVQRTILSRAERLTE
jgi:ABC-type sugar transport system permease subunit